jgi:hypothetical protein
VVLTAAIVGGVAWSNVLAYSQVWLAPRTRLAELEHIGNRYAGEGPALMTEFDPYGARHFLRRLDAEGASELRRRIIPLKSGQPVANQGYSDIDRIKLADLLVYRTLVLRRSPVESRPPSAYGLVERDHWYEVWQRSPTSRRILAHLSLGSELDPGAVPSCSAIQRLARTAGVTSLAAVPRRRVFVVPLTVLRRPASWRDGFVSGSVDPHGSGTLQFDLRLPRSTRYEVWAGGSFLGRISAEIDGKPVGAARHELEWSGQYVDLGRLQLGAGRHMFVLHYSYGGWRPGTHGFAPFPLGPVVVAQADPRAIVTVAPDQATSLCGRRLDWVEAVG